MHHGDSLCDLFSISHSKLYEALSVRGHVMLDITSCLSVFLNPRAEAQEVLAYYSHADLFLQGLLSPIQAGVLLDMPTGLSNFFFPGAELGVGRRKKEETRSQVCCYLDRPFLRSLWVVRLDTVGYCSA
jgi:hypothetical protein